VTEIHHFTYGVFNPIAAYLLAFLGSFFGLLCTARARDARTRGRRNRWLGIAAFSIGGGAIWLMHFAAMLGFDVPDSPVRFDILMTVISMVVAVVAVGLGLLIVGHGDRSLGKVLAAGVPAEKLTLSTDCGMKPLARMVAKMKLKALAEGARIVRGELMGTK